MTLLKMRLATVVKSLMKENWSPRKQQTSNSSKEATLEDFCYEVEVVERRAVIIFHFIFSESD